MEIKNKFNLNDKVYFVNNGQLFKGVIDEIIVSEKEIYYGTTSEPITSSYGYCKYVYEDTLFYDKKKAMEYWKNKTLENTQNIINAQIEILNKNG
ncbi:MAG: hypothetical protein EOL97_10080 [Spirochaetia bacterium]|nr:hypothetical protein [Spirochaetia bacterium]